MKRFFLLTIFLAISGLITANANSIQSKLQLIMGQNNSGTEFYFTIPPAYTEESAGGDNFIKIYVGSLVEANVEIEIPGKGVSIQQKIDSAGGVEEFKVTAEDGQPILHNGRNDDGPDAKVYKGSAVHVSSDAPIVVYVVVRYIHTSDGFLAIPTSALGKHYINSAYQDPGLGFEGEFTPWTGIVGVYDNTDVSFTMGGGVANNDAVPLENGLLKSGETTSEMIDKGDVWLLAINDDLQDHSGSIIKANKPIAVVSGMHCANFPVGNAWCDYSAEMETPVETWSNSYVIPPIPKRAFNGILRVYASEDNTTVYRDGEQWLNIAKGGGAPLGEGFAEERVWPMFGIDNEPNPPKPAVITSDKPISIVYYNPGVQEEQEYVSNANSDPFMMNILSTDNFSNTSLFMTPNAIGGRDPFPENYLNLVYEYENDVTPDDIEFGEIVGGNWKWTKFFDRFGGNPIEIDPVNGQKYAIITATLPIEGIYALRSDSTEFQNYSFGYGSYDSYGFPSGGGFEFNNIDDDNSPTIVSDFNEEENKYSGTIGDESSDGTTNLSKLYLLTDVSKNFKLEHNLEPGVSQEVNFTLEVTEPGKEAEAFLYAVDRSGNDTIFRFYQEGLPETLETPLLLEPANNTANLSTENGLKWNSVGEYENEYTIQISTVDDFSDNLIQEKTNDTTFNITGLETGTVYYWRIKARTNFATSPWSEVFSFVTALDKIDLLSPANNAEDQSITSVLLTWDNTTGAETYSLQVATDENFEEPIIDINQKLRREEMYDLEYNTTYYWRAKAVNEYGEGDWSDTWSFTTELNLSVYGNWEESGVEVFPNPVNDVLTLRNNNEKSGTFQITSVSGAVISNGSITSGTNEINFTEVSAGIYILVVEIDGNLFRYKVNKVN